MDVRMMSMSVLMSRPLMKAVPDVGVYKPVRMDLRQPEARGSLQCGDSRGELLELRPSVQISKLLQLQLVIKCDS